MALESSFSDNPKKHPDGLEEDALSVATTTNSPRFFAAASHDDLSIIGFLLFTAAESHVPLAIFGKPYGPGLWRRQDPPPVAVA